MTRQLGVVVVASVLFAACPQKTSPDSGVDAGQDAGSDADRHCRSYAETLCGRQIACGIAEASERANCEALAVSRCDLLIGAPERAGVTRVSPQVTGSCVEQLTNAPCISVEGTGYTACIYPGETRLAAGVIGSPCEGGSCLEGTCESGTSFCGVCTAFAAIGAPCGLCDPRVSFCSNTNICEAYRSDGATCTRGDQCSSGICNLSNRCGMVLRNEECRLQLECSEQDFCAGVTLNQVPGHCQKRTPLGDACTKQAWDSAGGCVLGSWCLDNRCVSPDAGSLSEGAECSSPSQCGPLAVCAGLFGMFTTGRCTTPTLGGPCVAEAQFCPAGARCIAPPDGGSCRPLRGLNEPCTNEDDRWDDCRVGLACRGAGDGGRQCEPLRAIGRICGHDRECLSMHCVRGMCAAPGGTGANCDAPYHCASNRCVFTSAGAGRCQESCF